MFDTNGNGRWDTGEYPIHQPEKIMIGKSEELRPNWDLELILDFQYLRKRITKYYLK